MTIQDKILQLIQDEIKNDPYNIGYAGKSDDEISQLLNNPVSVPKTVYTIIPSPINRILNGLSDAPNIIQATDVTAASSLKATALAGGV